MPQEIPLEANETFAYTPPSLANLDVPPVFVLRAPTGRDKRFMLRLYNEEGVRQHSQEVLREEVMTGLKNLWSAEDFDKFAPLIRNLWERQEDYAAQKRDDPDLVWDFDPDLEDRIEKLLTGVADAWHPLRKRLADNADYAQMSWIITVASVVLNWTGCGARLERDRGYLSIDCAAELRDALWEIESKAGLQKGMAWAELGTACTARLYLDGEEAKNLLSPAPSETNPLPSSETTASDKDGKSPAQAPSSETLEAE